MHMNKMGTKLHTKDHIIPEVVELCVVLVDDVPFDMEQKIKMNRNITVTNRGIKLDKDNMQKHTVSTWLFNGKTQLHTQKNTIAKLWQKNI